ncbi:MAG TPA: acyl-CoA desaturase [Bacteroidia bacterium]|nr:acyl-CoA desaturase [Bacteroidia bacterium]
MNAVRFVSNDKKQFATTLKKNVNDFFKEKNLSTKGNLNMVVKSIVMLTLYFVPFVLMLTMSMPGWILFLLWVLMGIGMAGVGMSVMHDAAHGSFSQKKWLNTLMSSTIYLIGGSVFTWKVQHNIKHHTFTNISGYDEDIDNKAIIRLSFHKPLKKIHRFQHIYAFGFYMLMTLNKMGVDFKQLFEYNKEGITNEQQLEPRSEIVKMVLQKIVYLFIFLGLPLLFTSYSWWVISLGFLLVNFIAGAIMSIVFQVAHIVDGIEQPLPNEGVIENQWAIHELVTTSNFSKNSRLFSWYIGGLNYQIEHHLFPNICHVHYRKIAPIVEKTAKEFGLKYNVTPTFFKAIILHIRMLKLLGTKKSYNSLGTV